MEFLRLSKIGVIDEVLLTCGVEENLAELSSSLKGASLFHSIWSFLRLY